MGRDHESNGCGAAALMMLLRHHKLPIRVPSHRDLCECLWLNVDPEIKGQEPGWGYGAYGSDVKRALEGMASVKEKIQHNAIEGDAKQTLGRITKALKTGPVMTAMKGRGFGGKDGHWVVITGCEDGELRYLDPQSTSGSEKRLPEAKFGSHWDYYAFFLKHPCNCAA
jgi:Papain-like cysteine protease AvrRpt2